MATLRSLAMNALRLDGYWSITEGLARTGSGTEFHLTSNEPCSFSGTFHAFNFDKYARRYLGGYCFRFNRRFSMVAMTERIANAACCCRPATERDPRVAEAYG
jgi:hypothetical protein